MRLHAPKTLLVLTGDRGQLLQRRLDARQEARHLEHLSGEQDRPQLLGDAGFARISWMISKVFPPPPTSAYCRVGSAPRPPRPWQ